MIYSLILLTLLGLGIGCKKEVEEVKPPVVVSPPTSTTTPPVSATPVAVTTTPTAVVSYTYTFPEDMATVNYGNVPTPPPGCRIIRVIYKTVSQNPKLPVEPEMITVNNTTFLVRTVTKTIYIYDQQKRLTQQLSEQLLIDVDSTIYTYASNYIIVKSSKLASLSATRYKSIDTLLLNSEGLSQKRPGDYTAAYFDKDGYLSRGEIIKNGEVLRLISQQIKDNNILKVDDYLSGGWGTTAIIYSYHLRHFNLPNPTPFYSRISQDLPTEESISNTGSIYFTNGLKYRIRYFYQFDNQGRVKRRISYGLNLKSDWPYERDGNGIGITDYEYECP